MSDSAHCASLLGQLNALRSWAESRALAVTRRLNELADETPGIFPEQILADATRVSLTQALQPFRRAEAVELMPEFGAALTSGAINVDHVNAVGSQCRRARQGHQGTVCPLVTGSSPSIASCTTSAEFGRTLRDEIRRAQTRRRHRPPPTTTAQHPATHLDRPRDRDVVPTRRIRPRDRRILQQRLNNAVEALFHDTTPDTCPTDPLDKQHHFRALALFSLTSGNSSGRAGSIDLSVLIDAKPCSKVCTSIR